MVLLDNGDVFESNDLKGDACGRIFQAGLLQQTKSNLDSWRKGFHLQICDATVFSRPKPWPFGVLLQGRVSFRRVVVFWWVCV